MVKEPADYCAQTTFWTTQKCSYSNNI